MKPKCFNVQTCHDRKPSVFSLDTSGSQWRGPQRCVTSINITDPQRHPPICPLVIHLGTNSGRQWPARGTIWKTSVNMCVNHADPKRWSEKSLSIKSSCGWMSTGLTAGPCQGYSQILALVAMNYKSLSFQWPRKWLCIHQLDKALAISCQLRINELNSPVAHLDFFMTRRVAAGCNSISLFVRQCFKMYHYTGTYRLWVKKNLTTYFLFCRRHSLWDLYQKVHGETFLNSSDFNMVHQFWRQ